MRFCKKGRLVEVFPSIQGEGLQMGAMQLFIRFAGCNLGCRTCDTRQAWKAPLKFPMRPWPGHSLQVVSNPVTADALLKIVSEAYPLRDFHSVALTGGEPLVQSEFATELAEKLKNLGTRVFVETNGTLSDKLFGLLPWVSFWSVDLKLSRGWGLDGAQGKIFQAHRDFIHQLPAEGAYLKLVLDANDDPDELCRTLVLPEFKKFPLVIQPFATGQSNLSDWDSATILEWICLLNPMFKEVRWVPQVHKLLRIP